MKRLIVIVLTSVMPLVVGAECKMDSPETTLKCYEEYTKNKDVASLKAIYWELKDFHFTDLVNEESAYKIIERKEYKDHLELENHEGKPPIWAKKGNVELVSVKFTNGQKDTYSHIFRNINGKWYMVGHYGHGVDDFIDE